MSKTWYEFMHTKIISWEHAMLVQAIVVLSVEPGWSDKTPDEIFDHLNQTRQ